MSGPEMIRPSSRVAVVHSRSASMPSEIPTPLSSPVRHPAPQSSSPVTLVTKNMALNRDQLIDVGLMGRTYPVAIYSPQLGRQFNFTAVSTANTMRTSREITPPAGISRGFPLAKLLAATKYNSCTNSPLANHKTMTGPDNMTDEQPSTQSGLRLFWHRSRSGEAGSSVNHVTSASGATPDLYTNTVGRSSHSNDHQNSSTTVPTTARNKSNNQVNNKSPTITTTNNNTSTTSTHTTGRNMFFQRLRWRRSQRGTRSSSNSANSSPILTGSGISSHTSVTAASVESNVNRVSDIAASSTACVKLVDTQITKGPNGFGLTLAEVLTFIPNKLLGLRSPAGVSADKVGFYQRLLQIRAVNAPNSPGGSQNQDSFESGCFNSSVRAGDMLLAVEGFRLAGCTPEYAVRLLAGIPVGGQVHVTLLRGLDLAPIAMRSKPDEFRAGDCRHSAHESQTSNQNKSPIEKLTNGRARGQQLENKSPVGKSTISKSMKEEQSDPKSPYDNVCTNGSKEKFELELYKQPEGFGFSFIRMHDTFVIEHVSPNISYTKLTGQKNRKLQPGDQLLEMGHMKLEPLSEAQAIHLLESYPVGKSLRFLISRDCDKCATPILGIIPLNDTSPQIETTVTAVTTNSLEVTTSPSVTGTTLHTVSPYTLMPFQWFCGTGTSSGASSTSPKSSSGLKCTGKHEGFATSSNLPDAVAGLIPFRCPLQGVGISGPCKTPDYVPASHFLAAVSHGTTDPVAGLSPLIVTPLTDSQRAQPNTSLASIPVTLSPYASSLNSSELSTSGPVNSSTPVSAIETTVLIPANVRSCGFQLSQEPIQDNMLSVTEVNPEVLSALSNCIAVGDLLVAVDGKPVAGLSQDGVMQLMQSNASSNSNDGLVRLTFRGARKSQSVKPDGSNLPSASSEPSSRLPGKIRFRSFEQPKPENTTTTISKGLEHGPDVPVDDLAWISSTSSPVTMSKEIEDMSDAYNVELRRQENEGFGFVIVSSLNSNKASEIGRIIPGSPADKCGKLSVGNKIIAINGQMLSGLHHTEIVQQIRQSQQHLILTVQCPRKASDTIGEWKTSMEHSFHSKHESSDAQHDRNEYNCEIPETQPTTDSLKTPHSKPPQTISVQSIYAVTLRRGSQGFGFSIRGGLDFERIPLFVFRIAAGGPAQLDGRMQIGDEIMEINGVATHSFTHQQAVNAIRQSGDQLSLLLSRLSSRLCETGV